MARSIAPRTNVAIPAPRDVLELLKPITWFPPMWAFMCGVVSSGVPIAERWPFLGRFRGLLLRRRGRCLRASNTAARQHHAERHDDERTYGGSLGTRCSAIKSVHAGNHVQERRLH